MPCNNAAPDPWDINRSEVDRLRKEVDNLKSSLQPPPNSVEFNKLKEDVERMRDLATKSEAHKNLLDNVAAMMCRICRRIEKHGQQDLYYDEEIAHWIKEHKQWDEQQGNSQNI